LLMVGWVSFLFPHFFLRSLHGGSPYGLADSLPAYADLAHWVLRRRQSRRVADCIGRRRLVARSKSFSFFLNGVGSHRETLMGWKGMRTGTEIVAKRTVVAALDVIE
jgi:hypothetical protein